MLTGQAVGKRGGTIELRKNMNLKKMSFTIKRKN